LSVDIQNSDFCKKKNPNQKNYIHALTIRLPSKSHKYVKNPKQINSSSMYKGTLLANPYPPLFCSKIYVKKIEFQTSN
jgi:hypothetical protein